MIFFISFILLMISSVSGADVYINQGDNWTSKLDTASSNDNVVFNNTKIENFTYSFNKPLNISGVNTTLVGGSSWYFNSGSSGSFIVNLTFINSSFVPIYLNNVSDITVRDCTIDHPANNGIDIVYGSRNIVIENVNILNFGSGLGPHRTGIWADSADNVLIKNVYIFNSTNFGLAFFNSSNINITNSRIKDCVDNGIWIGNSSVISMSNVSITGVNNSGIWIENGSYNITINLANISKNLMINHTDSAGIHAVGIQNITVNDSIISNNGARGLFLISITNINITNTTVYNTTENRLERSNYVLLDNITIDRSSGSGLRIAYVNNFVLNRSTISNSYNYGLFVIGLYNFTISYNNITRNTNPSTLTAARGTNMWFQNCQNGEIVGNNITLGNLGSMGLASGSGIALDGGDRNISIYNNNISNNGRHGITAGASNTDIHIFNNIFRGNSFVSIKTSGTFFYIYNNTISNSALSYGIQIDGGLNCEVYNNTVFDCSSNGIHINGNNNRIYSNNISFNRGSGIYIDTGYSNNSITNNTVSNSTNYGIYILGTNNNITSNNITGNKQHGIYITGSNNTLITNNVTNNIQYGVYITGSNNTLITNNVTNNVYDGIRITGNNNSFSDGLVSNNNRTGFLISGNNNTIDGSNIINNNGFGFNVTGSGNKLNYNRILNNNGFDLFNAGNDTNANLNWWGNNIPLISGILLDNWFVMQLAANNFTTIVNDTTKQPTGIVNMSYQLVLYNNVTKTTGVVSHGSLPYFAVNVTWKDNNGNIVYNITDDARAYYSYNFSLNQNNNFVLEAIGDNEDIILYLEHDTKVNLTIAKTVNVTGDVVNGQIIIYTIIVSNNGPDNATGVIVNEKLPDSLIYISNSQGSVYDPVSGVWTVGNLNNGETMTLVITVRVNATTNGNNVTVVNIVNITANQNNTGENETNATITVVPGVNLTVTKTVNVTGDVVNGQIIIYTIIVSNNGPDNATGVIVNEKLPDSLIYISNSQGSVYDPVSGVWAIGDLNNGEILTLVITVKVNGTGVIANSVNITADQANINNETNNTNVTANITAKTQNTTLTITAKVSGDGKTMLIKGRLTDEAGNPLANKVINFYVNGKYIGQELTDNDGIARINYTSEIPFKNGNYTITNIFAGDNEYSASLDTTNLEINNNPNNNETNETINTGASMKKTGVPMMAIAIIFLLLSLFVFGIQKKDEK